MNNLYPPIETIEEDLFSPSDELMDRWVSGDASLSAEIRSALEADVLACAKRDAMPDRAILELDEIFAEEVTATSGEPQISPLLLEMIEKRVATRENFGEADELAPGQIRLVDKTIGPEGIDLNWDMNQPLAVLLLRETEEDDIWYGWMMGREPDYAAFCDVLLEKEDEPYDPFVSMVQLWNPVNIHTKTLGSVLGQVSQARLKTLVSAFSDMLTADQPDPAYARPGTLIDRLTSNGERCLTGTPIGKQDDPRIRYQQLYFAAAGMVKDMAELVVLANVPDTKSEQESWADLAISVAQALKYRILESLDEFAHSLGGSLQPVTFVAAQDSGREEAFDWHSVSGEFEVAVIPSEDGTSARLLLKHVRDKDLVIKLKLEEDLLQQHHLDKKNPNAEIYFEIEPRLVLEFETSLGSTDTWPLPF